MSSLDREQNYFEKIKYLEYVPNLFKESRICAVNFGKVLKNLEEIWIFWEDFRKIWRLEKFW